MRRLTLGEAWRKQVAWRDLAQRIRMANHHELDRKPIIVKRKVHGTGLEHHRLLEEYQVSQVNQAW